MDVDAVAVDGEWIRHAPHRSSLLGRASEATDGRWQHGEVVRALYLADEPATAIAEWYRLLAESGLPPGRAILTTTTCGSSTSTSPTSAHRNGWPA
jgi:RES domain